MTPFKINTTRPGRTINIGADDKLPEQIETVFLYAKRLEEQLNAVTAALADLGGPAVASKLRPFENQRL